MFTVITTLSSTPFPSLLLVYGVIASGLNIHEHQTFKWSTPIVAFIQDSTMAKLLHIGLAFMLQIVGAVMAFVVLQSLAGCIPWDTKWFKFFSKYSMVIYLVHQQVIYLWILLFNGMVHPYIHGVINFGGTMVISSLIAVTLVHFKFTRVLVGEK